MHESLASARSRPVWRGVAIACPMRFLLAVAIAAAAMHGTAMAGFIAPTGLAAGSQYQILFVTADTIAGTSGAESDYNSFVQTEAAPLTAILPLGTTWLMRSRRRMTGANYNDASGNISNDPALPVFNTQGQEVSFSPFYLWAGPLNAAVLYDQNGSAVHSQVWTGSVISGGEPVATLMGNALGQSTPTYGDSDTSTAGWLDAGTAPADSEYHVYALSSPISVVPEPATLVLFGSGIAGSCTGSDLLARQALTPLEVLRAKPQATHGAIKKVRMETVTRSRVRWGRVGRASHRGF